MPSNGSLRQKQVVNKWYWREHQSIIARRRTAERSETATYSQLLNQIRYWNDRRLAFRKEATPYQPPSSRANQERMVVDDVDEIPRPTNVACMSGHEREPIGTTTVYLLEMAQTGKIADQRGQWLSRSSGHRVCFLAIGNAAVSWCLLIASQISRYDRPAGGHKLLLRKACPEKRNARQRASMPRKIASQT